MQNNKIVLIFVGLIAIFASIYGMSELVTMTDAVRNVWLGVLVFVILLLSLWRKVPLDAKLLFIIIIGYAFGGKGFAYVSPFEPIYIGEICLSLCMFGLLLRLYKSGLLSTPVHIALWLLLIYSGIHLMKDYVDFGLLALRDSATIYYGLYFFAAYVLMDNEDVRKVFFKVLVISAFLAALSTIALIFLQEIIPVEFRIGYSPHPDALIPLVVGGAFYFSTKLLEEKKLSYLLFAVLFLVLILFNKTAALMASFLLLSWVILFAGMRRMILPLVVLGCCAVVALSFMLIFTPDILHDYVASSDHAETFGNQSENLDKRGGATTDWRLTWWEYVWDTTMAYGPLLGQGFGADLSSHFLEDYYGIDPRSPQALAYARYPHNILFTVFGRLGFAGLFLFLIFFWTVFIGFLRFSRKILATKERTNLDLLAFGVCFAGVSNSLVQATYEVPYGAITHWTTMGYVMWRVYGKKPRKEQQPYRPMNSRPVAAMHE